jgi:DNA-binding winged helix-turn-helix (wHTH) protein
VLIRVFRGQIREGAHDRLIRGLHDHVLPRLDADPGVLSATLAFSLNAGGADEYLLETRWRDLRDLIRFAGDDWMTPRVDPGEEELLVSVSAHHYVADGIDPPSTGPRPSPTVVRLDEVEIDGEGLQVTWNGSAIHLPPREMVAMLALASDPGAPVSSPELARRIWPGSVLVGPYDVRRVIHRLRAVLRSGCAPIEIRNVHGRGYGVVLPPRSRPGIGDTSGTPSRLNLVYEGRREWPVVHDEGATGGRQP